MLMEKVGVMGRILSFIDGVFFRPSMTPSIHLLTIQFIHTKWSEIFRRIVKLGSNLSQYGISLYFTPTSY